MARFGGDDDPGRRAGRSAGAGGGQRVLRVATTATAVRKSTAADRVVSYAATVAGPEP